MTEVLLCASRRTPIGRYGGALAALRPDDMAARVIYGLLDFHLELVVDEVILRCANHAGEDNRNVARMAALLSRRPETAPALTVNKLCASGHDAVTAGARAIRDGANQIIAGGVEQMTRAPFVMAKGDTAFGRQAQVYDTTTGWRFVKGRIAAPYSGESMPQTAESVAADHGISSVDQDAYAVRSQVRHDAGWHSTDIVLVAKTGAPFTAFTGRQGSVGAINADAQLHSTSLEKLSALPAPFRADGTVTAGNTAGINDGAGAIILAPTAAIRRYGLVPIARLGQAVSAWVAPRVMDLGPIAALDRQCTKSGLCPGPFDVTELKKVLAAQVLACTRAWGLADNAAHVPAQVCTRAGRRALQWAIPWAYRARGSSGAAHARNERQKRRCHAVCGRGPSCRIGAAFCMRVLC